MRQPRGSQPCLLWVITQFPAGHITSRWATNGAFGKSASVPIAAAFRAAGRSLPAQYLHRDQRERRRRCKRGRSAGSLRQAIFDANENVGSDTIQFAAGLTGTITLTADELAISDSLTIQGPGAANLTIDAAGKSRIFDVDDGDSGTNIDVQISGLTLTGGSADTGGAILSHEKLTVNSSTITGNTAGVNGGGIYAYSPGTTTIQNSTISENTTSRATAAESGRNPTLAARRPSRS